MVQVKVVRKKSQRHAVGIHIFKPTEYELESAKEEAMNKGFRVVWVHKRKGY